MSLGQASLSHKTGMCILQGFCGSEEGRMYAQPSTLNTDRRYLLSAWVIDTFLTVTGINNIRTLAGRSLLYFL